MNVWSKVLVWILFGLMVVPAPVLVPEPATAQDAPKFKPEELEQIVAPIALHPDGLLAQVLMASTYPMEIIEAARFVKANPNLKEAQLEQELQKYTWDDSVKSLVMFPQVLAMMNEKLDWLQKLGDAFLSQQQDLLAAIQRLRARAQAEGQLKDTKEQKVIVEQGPAGPAGPQGPPGPPGPPGQSAPPPTVIRIEPTNPEVIYVPSYNPQVVYGAWPPAYPPYYPYPPGYFAAGAFTFMAGAAVGAAIWGNCNWGGGEVNINNNVSNNFSNRVNNSTEARNRVEQRQKSGTGQGGRSNWQHNPEHRKGAQYRDSATQQRFNKSGPANAQAREQFRGRTEQGGGLGGREQGGRGQQGGLGGGREQGGRGQQGGLGGGREQGGLGGGREQGGLGGGREQGGLGGGDRGGNRAQATPRSGGSGVGQGGGGVRQAGGFEGMGGGGRDAQSFSNRGNASRESVSRSSGGSRAGGAGAGAGARGGGGGGARGGGGGGGRGGGRR